MIYLVRTQNSSKNQDFLPRVRTRSCAYEGVRDVIFSDHLAYLLDE